VDTAPKEQNKRNNTPENHSPLFIWENGRSVNTRPDPPSAGESTRFDPKRLPSQTRDGGNTMNIDEHTNGTQWKGEEGEDAGFVLSPGDESEASTRNGGLFSDDGDDDERNDGLVDGGEESECNDRNGFLVFSGEEGTCERNDCYHSVFQI